MFLSYLGYFCVFGVVCIYGYATWHDRHRTALNARKKALLEARAALLSLAERAKAGAIYRAREGQHHGASVTRAHFYEKSAAIVASIPVDRL